MLVRRSSRKVDYTSSMSGYESLELPSNVLELPSTWLASLFQHAASGPGGLASAAALSQTCSSLHALSESSAVSYRSLHATQPISSAEHPLWQWLAKRKGRITGLGVKVELDASLSTRKAKAWEGVLQTLSSIRDLHLTVSWVRDIFLRSVGVSSQKHPFIRQWLGQYGHCINHLDAHVGFDAQRLPASTFCKAAAVCRSLRLDVAFLESLDCNDFAPVSASLIGLTLRGVDGTAVLRDLGSLTCFQQLTALSLTGLDLADEDPWSPLAALTGLTQLDLDVAAYGDPSALSALTGLRSLSLGNRPMADNDATPFSLSSLQPLSRMQQLEFLELAYCWGDGSSLEGLAGLSRLTELKIQGPSGLKTLEGASTAIRILDISHAPGLGGLYGAEGLVALESLSLNRCGVASLESLAGLGSLRCVEVETCPVNSLGFLGGSLGTCLQELILFFCDHLSHLKGLETLSALQQLKLWCCGVTSLQPVAELDSGLKVLEIKSCNSIQEEVLELPHVLPTADVNVFDSNVQEVVLAGGVRRAVGCRNF